jgi:V/A-type H+-transporting ATPase subunit I
MKKVSLIIMDKTSVNSLEKVRELGLMHLEKRPVSSDILSKLVDQKTKVETVLGILRAQPVLKNITLRYTGSDGIVGHVLSIADKRKSLQEQLITNAKERSRIEKWRNFNPTDLNMLASWGIVLTPYEISHKVHDNLGDDQHFIVLGTDKTTVYGLAVGTEIVGENPWVVPEHSLIEIDQITADINKCLVDINNELTTLVVGMSHIESELCTIVQEIEFETARLGMERTADVSADMMLSWLTGFVPVTDIGKFKRAAADNGWALAITDPSDEDNPPTLLKNNRLVSLIYPLTGFMEIVPGYREVDISGWFLLFFCIFFGMIFGDAGYGLLLAFIGIIGIAKTAKEGVPAILKMLLLLSISNIVWGVLTCTWFGIESAKLPTVLQKISLPLISSANENEVFVSQNLQVFCFSLALLQLSIAHIKGIVKNRKTLRLLGELGSLVMLWGIYPVVLYLVVNATRFPFLEGEFLKVVLGLVGGGFALTFVFASYEGNIGQSILTSLKNIISVILGITNIFSDIMSYIRLWAVGLAGASISATVNSMAGPLLGNFLIFLGIILLVFGHGLNIILNVLSVLVHGVRLNTLEFSGHLGLTWSGFAYKPFSKTVK